MTAREAFLSLDELGVLFPFYLIIDEDLRVWKAGAVLGRLLPELQAGPRLDHAFEVPRFAGDVTFERLGADPARCLVLRSRTRPELVLRGQVLRRGSILLFAVAPRIAVDAMKSLGLSVTDFAVHDAIADYLFLVQAQQSSLAEACRLSEELALVNAELEARVAARTSELQRTNDELAATLETLASVNARLEAEMLERGRVEAELRLAQRLESVGQLAAGVAHEINTPIQYVSDSLYFLNGAFSDLLPVLATTRETVSRLTELGATDAAQRVEAAWDDADADFVLEQAPKALERAQDGVDRVAKIVRAMKAFAHPGADEARAEDLNAALANTLVVANNEYKYVADVEADYGELPLVTCRLGELNQVFLNLVVNAAHAIDAVVAGGDARGRITVRTRHDGDAAVIEVEDTGAGIPDDIRDKIWDPFFTTKPVGKGTGQGLTIARTIVARHGGTLSFEPGAGGRSTRFVVRLPVGSENAACLQ